MIALVLLLWHEVFPFDKRTKQWNPRTNNTKLVLFGKENYDITSLINFRLVYYSRGIFLNRQSNQGKLPKVFNVPIDSDCNFWYDCSHLLHTPFYFLFFLPVKVHNIIEINGQKIYKSASMSGKPFFWSNIRTTLLRVIWKKQIPLN